MEHWLQMIRVDYARILYLLGRVRAGKVNIRCMLEPWDIHFSFSHAATQMKIAIPIDISYIIYARHL